MSLSYQLEPFAAIEGEARGFVKDYLKEFPSTFESEIDWEMLRAMDRLRVMKVASARDEGMLVGFCLFTLAPHHHAKGVLVAQELSLFLLRDYRKGRTGLRLLDFVEKMAKELGAKYMLMTTRGGVLPALLSHRGYSELETVYSKGLD